MKSVRYLAYLFGLAAVLQTGLVYAEEIPDDFQFRLGTYRINNVDTRFNAGPGGGLVGTNIRYSKDLGGEENESVPRVQGYYRFNDEHRLNYGWYKVERGGTRTLEIDIDFGDESYMIGTTVSSFINAEIWKLTYQYSFYHNDKVELGFSAGLFVMDYDVGISDTAGGQVETESVLAPLPVFGFHLDYVIMPRWRAFMDVDVFYLELENEVEGSISDFQVATEYRITRNIALGLAINTTTLDVSVDDSDFRGNLNDSYKGYEVYAAVYF